MISVSQECQVENFFTVSAVSDDSGLKLKIAFNEEHHKYKTRR